MLDEKSFDLILMSTMARMLLPIYESSPFHGIVLVNGIPLGFGARPRFGWLPG